MVFSFNGPQSDSKVIVVTPVLKLIEELPVLFEDETVLVVDKPSGLLSQPGKTVSDSVLTRVRENRNDIHGPALVHRLDMDTSGILLLAKTRSAHRHLQQQFEHRRIGKRYVAVLENPCTALGGIVHLPLRLDVQNRPTQIVCHQHGKVSTTIWHRLAKPRVNGVVLYPLTGRTHQLRVHLAHRDGLGNPVKGDRLYGSAQHRDGRLLLHAEVLSFEHPVRGNYQRIFSPAPFVA